MKNILAKQQKSAQIFEFPQKAGAREAAEEKFVKDSIKAQEDLNENTAGLSKTEKELIKENKKLSDNVKKLADEIKKQSFFKDTAKGASEETAKGITETATGRRQFRTIGDRIGDFKDKAKDFLTPRGFLDKTGIVKRGTGGVLSDMLDRGEEKKKYIKARMETKGNTFGDEKTFGRQFDEQQKIQRKMVKNESVIKGYEDLGFKDTQIKRSDAFKTRTGLAEDLIKVDTRVRPTKDEAPVAKTRSQGLLDAANTSEADTEAVSREENQLELLTKIEENTRPGGIKKLKEPAEKGFLASLLDFFTNKFGSILASALSMGKTLATGALGVGKSVLGKLGGSGMAGKVLGRTAAVAGGLYEGYTAWNEADEKVKSGEITQRQGTVEKGGAVGKGLGTTGGALAGGKLGAMIGTAILPGVGTAVGGIIGGIVGGLAGGKFGQEIGKMATDGALKLKDGFDEYVKKPFMEFFDGISKMFNESIVKPLTEFFQPITDFFKNMSTSISDAFTNFSIPEMGVEILGKKFSIGPFYPFKKEVKASKPIPPGNSDAGAGAGSSEFAKTDPRRLDKLESTNAKLTPAEVSAKNKASFDAELKQAEAEMAPADRESALAAAKASRGAGSGNQTALDAKFDKGMAKARGKIAAVPEGDSVRVQGKLVKAEDNRLVAKQQYQEGNKEEEAAKQKIEAFKKDNPFDIKEKGEIETGTFKPAKFSDPEKQKKYDALMDASYQASDKKEKAKTAYETTDNTQRDKINKRGQPTENPQAIFAKKDALITRFGYKDSDLLNDDGKSYSMGKINAAYDAKVKQDLLAPVSPSGKVQAVPEGDSVRSQGKIVGQKTDTLLGGERKEAPNSRTKRDAIIKAVMQEADARIKSGSIKNMNAVTDATDDIMSVYYEGTPSVSMQSLEIIEKMLRTKLMAGMVGGNGTIVNGKPVTSEPDAPGEMKKGTYDKMSSKPTIVNADGTKRLMTPQEITAAKEGMLNKTSMAAPTEASAVYNKSAANAGAAIVPAAAPSNTVIAPTTNVSNNTTQIVRLPSRNQDVSLQKYMNSRYGM